MNRNTRPLSLQTPWIIIAAALILASQVISGCGRATTSAGSTGSDLPPVGTTGTVSADGVVVKSRIMFTVSAGSPTALNKIVNSILPSAYAATSGTENVTVVNAPNTNMTLDASNWNVPTISNSLLDFGFIAVGSLSDNNLDACGSNGKTHCGTALFRMYTTGQSGAGLWNSTDQFGAPITAGLSSGALGSVGLNVAGAYILQSISLPNNKHTVSLSDFSPAAKYDVKVDFTNAGSGTYTTTIVLEYGLSS